MATAVLLISGLLLWAWIVPFARRLAAKPAYCMLLLAALPVALRLALLASSPIPTPSTSDDFSYLLLGNTLSHLRLANPTHPWHQFFETDFVLQQPTYSSIYPMGQGIALAVGQTLFGYPWAGVVLSIAAFSAACYWMLRGWTTPEWALVGGLLAVFEFGPLNQWMNTYWGGGVSAIAGCLVFGSISRLRARARTRDAMLLGGGLGLELLTRPYEFVLLFLSAMLLLSPELRSIGQWRRFANPALFAGLAIMPAVALTLFQNKAVTGGWTTLPYLLSRYQYGVPATFTFEPNATPHRPLTPQQELDYGAQSAIHGPGTDSVRNYFERLLFRVRYYRFFFVTPLYIAVLAFLFALRRNRYRGVLLTLLLFSSGANFYPYFYPHYIAAATCLFVLVSVAGLEQLTRFTIGGRPVGVEAARILVLLATAHFLFWYGVHLFATEELLPAMRYETWDFINYGDPEGRIAVNRELADAPGKQLVFVRYAPSHRFREWVHNAADIDSARIVWARDLGDTENGKLQAYYRDRRAWLLEPDAERPKLTSYTSVPAQ